LKNPAYKLFCCLTDRIRQVMLQSGCC
jgi:hypothetical protein